MLVLRTCDKNMKSRNGFEWPQSGPVECPDWDSKPECGNGLHGFAWGEGDGNLANWESTAKWLVVEVDDASVVGLGGKVKFPRGNVVFCGEQKEATDYIIAHGARGPVIGATIVAGDRGTASAGDYGTASAGDCGTASAGYGGTASAGDYGTASAGCEGTASAGDKGTARAGYKGTASAGDYGTASAGDYGIIQIKYYNSRYRILTGYIGEDGLLPNTKYKVENGKFVVA
jgi:hypothetical protein